MKHFMFALIFSVPLILYAQVGDDFSDGDFTVDPAWTGDTDDFEVNGSLQLHLKAGESDTSLLVSENHLGTDCEWNFWVKLSFNTSANNHCRIYLVSDTSLLKGPVHGYFLQLGGSRDSMAIFRQDGTEQSEIFRLHAGVLSHSVNSLRFRILRENGLWSVGVDTTGGTNYLDEGTFIENSYTRTSFFGIFCRYTSSNSAKFYFDDIYAGEIVRDTIPPEIISVKVLDELRIAVLFNEVPDNSNSQDTSHYIILNSNSHPVSALEDPDNRMSIILTRRFEITPETCDTLLISGITDVAGNLMTDTRVVFCLHHASAYDILINEVMADPAPSVSLPGSEYIELFNRSALPVDMGGWSLDYGTATRVFPDVSILPGAFLILSSDTAFLAYGNMIPLFSGNPNLSNEGATLTLRDSRHRIIHSVDYSSGWYAGTFKENGGWSLEMADPGNPCGCEDNWQASTDGSGGTPGRINSSFCKNPDLEKPSLGRAFIDSPNILRLLFSEKMDSTGLCARETWQTSQGMGVPDSLVMMGPGYSSIGLYYDESFDTGVVYTVTCDTNSYDCAGNRMSAGMEVRAAIPGIPSGRDVMISEILPEPQPGGSRYIEVYNNSINPLDLSDLQFRYTPGTDSATGETRPLAAESFIIFPGDFVALCTDDADVKARYFTPDPNLVISMESMPAFSKESGKIDLLRSTDGELIDGMRYEASMHHPLISVTAGVSLEKINLSGLSEEPSNWHSASAGSGYGTPGYRNSQFRQGSDKEEEGIELAPRVFSPDNDGRDDLLGITVVLRDEENVATISIFNSRGMLVRQISNSILMGPENVYVWDGITADRQKAQPGIYYLYVEIINPKGNARHLRKSFAVTFPG